MLNHVVVGSNDIERSRAFYDPVLEALNVGQGTLDRLPGGTARLIYQGGGNRFVVSEPIDGNPATVGNGGTIAFRCEDVGQVQRFHEAAVANGGASIEDAPGLRQNPLVGDIYAAYVRDPDGNKLCATHRLASSRVEGGSLS